MENIVVDPIKVRYAFSHSAPFGCASLHRNYATLLVNIRFLWMQFLCLFLFVCDFILHTKNASSNVINLHFNKSLVLRLYWEKYDCSCSTLNYFDFCRLVACIPNLAKAIKLIHCAQCFYWKKCYVPFCTPLLLILL